MACKKVDCILPERSQYHVLHHFTIKISEALQRAGHAVRLLSAEECASACSLDPPDMTLGLNGAPQIVKDLFLCDVIEVPHAALLMDPPYYYLGLLESPYIEIFCDDETNINVLQSFGCSNAAFLTQGVEPELIDEPEMPKEYDIVFFASYFDVDKAKEVWKEHLPDELCRIMDAAISETLQDESKNLPQSFEKALGGRIDLLNRVNIFDLLYEMSYVQKGQARIDLLKSLKNLPIHVWDNRWKEQLNHSGNFIVHDAVDYPEALGILKKSKIVLCNSIRSVRGCNERVLNALACNALPVTNANPYYDEHFQDAKDLLMYTKDDLHLLEEKVLLYLDNANLRGELVQSGKKKVSLHHTWDNRIRTLFKE